MRIKASNFPNVFVERVETQGTEIARERVYVEDRVLGDIVYLRRDERRNGKVIGSSFGWVPALSPRKYMALRTKTAAIQTILDRVETPSPA